MKKRCWKCRRTKPIEEFHCFTENGEQRYVARCIQCYRDDPLMMWVARAVVAKADGQPCPTPPWEEPVSPTWDFPIPAFGN